MKSRAEFERATRSKRTRVSDGPAPLSSRLAPFRFGLSRDGTLGLRVRARRDGVGGCGRVVLGELILDPGPLPSPTTTSGSGRRTRPGRRGSVRGRRAKRRAPARRLPSSVRIRELIVIGTHGTTAVQFGLLAASPGLSCTMRSARFSSCPRAVEQRARRRSRSRRRLAVRRRRPAAPFRRANAEPVGRSEGRSLPGTAGNAHCLGRHPRGETPSPACRDDVSSPGQPGRPAEG